MGEIGYKELSFCFKTFILEYILIVTACRLLSPALSADDVFPCQFGPEDHRQLIII